MYIFVPILPLRHYSPEIGCEIIPQKNNGSDNVFFRNWILPASQKRMQIFWKKHSNLGHYFMTKDFTAIDVGELCWKLELSDWILTD